MEQFENLTIAELRKLTEDYKELEKQNMFLRAKYPTKAAKLNSGEKSTEELLKEVGVDVF